MVRRKPINGRLPNGKEVRERGLNRVEIEGVTYVYHQASGVRLPDLPTDHPEFVEAYDAAQATLTKEAPEWKPERGVRPSPLPRINRHQSPKIVAFDLHQVARFVLGAKKGETMIYFSGDLAISQQKDQNLRERAQYLRIAADLGLVRLQQFRISAGWNDYFATRSDESIAGCPKHVLRCNISPSQYLALVAIMEKQAAVATSRAIRDHLGTNDTVAAQMRNEMINNGWLDNGRPPELTDLGLALLT